MLAAFRRLLGLRDPQRRRQASAAFQARNIAELAAAEAALTVNPDDVKALSSKANALWELRRLEESLPVFDRVLRLAPGRTSDWITKADVLAHLGRCEEALTVVDEALRLHPNEPTLYDVKALLLRDMGRDDEAKDVEARGMLPR